MSVRLRHLAAVVIVGVALPSCGDGSNPFTAGIGDTTEPPITIAPAVTAPPTTVAPAAPAATTTTPPATTTSTSTTTTTAPPDLTGTTVTILGVETSEAEIGAIQAALDDFSIRSGIDIAYEGVRDFSQQIEIRAGAGDPPDIGIFAQPRQVRSMAADGHIRATPAATIAAVAPFLTPGWLDMVSVTGTTFGVPVKANAKSLVWYNTETVGDTAIPTTWADLVALSEDIAASGTAAWCEGIESGSATGWPFTDWVEQQVIGFHGPAVYDQWTRHEIPFDDALIAGATQHVIDLWALPGMVWAERGTIGATPFTDNARPLAAGDCAMYRQADFFASLLPPAVTLGPGGDVDVFSFPPAAVGSRPVLVAGMWAAAFDDRPEIWAVIDYMGSAEYAEARQVTQGDTASSSFFPANNSVDRSLWAPWQQSILEILFSASVVRPDGSDEMPAAVGAGTFWSEGTRIANLEVTVPAGLATIEASWP